MNAALTAPEWTAYQTWVAANLTKRYGNASRDGYLSGFRDGVVHGLNLRQQWDRLSTEEKLVELRLGTASDYFIVFEDDPTCWADCDSHGRVVVLAEGVCTQCGRPVHEARGLAS